MTHRVVPSTTGDGGRRSVRSVRSVPSVDLVAAPSGIVTDTDIR